MNVRYICKPWRIYFPKRGLLEYKLEFYTAVEWVQPTLAASAWVPKINVRYSIVHLVWALCGDRGRGPLGPECCVSAASHHPYSCAECILSKYRLFVKVYPLLMLQKLGWSVFCSGTINGSPRMRKVFTVLLNVISFTLASLSLEHERWEGVFSWLQSTTSPLDVTKSYPRYLLNTLGHEW